MQIKSPCSGPDLRRGRCRQHCGSRRPDARHNVILRLCASRTNEYGRSGMKDYFFNTRDDFHYDHSGYYGYIVFNGDKQTCDGLLKALGQGPQPGGLGWYRYGKSFRPANDGKMYNWYIRLHSGGSEKPAAQAVDDFLRGHLEPPKPAPLLALAGIDCDATSDAVAITGIFAEAISTCAGFSISLSGELRRAAERSAGRHCCPGRIKGCCSARHGQQCCAGSRSAGADAAEAAAWRGRSAEQNRPWQKRRKRWKNCRPNSLPHRLKVRETDRWHEAYNEAETQKSQVESKQAQEGFRERNGFEKVPGKQQHEDAVTRQLWRTCANRFTTRNTETVAEKLVYWKQQHEDAVAELNQQKDCACRKATGGNPSPNARTAA